jgi:deoxyribodipyrimidine photo-lyase
MQHVNIVWFRRDLRLHDHAALSHALQAGLPILPVFIFDTAILDKLEESDRRVPFIHAALTNMKSHLHRYDADMYVHYGNPMQAFEQLRHQYQIHTVFAAHDYEPYAIRRDEQVAAFLQQHSIQWVSVKDQVVFEKDEVVKDDGKPYTVYTPYSKKWKSKLKGTEFEPFDVQFTSASFASLIAPPDMPSLSRMGFRQSDTEFPSRELNLNIIDNYHAQRDIPGISGTSRLGVHLRFGTISIRELAKVAMSHNEKFLNELIWRDFYQAILWHFPHVIGHAFKPQYDQIQWENNEVHFDEWCAGQTGYPIVDAGMRELNATGFMHNRVRMIVASFLAKHLLIDWRWGEAYFAKQLLDFDLASNNGGWQWAAGSGVDAAPYFRVFNPYLQTQKFDPQFSYIRKWVPEFEQLTYPKPIVSHEFARTRCLARYKQALSPA